jgi:site-specific DNA-cytosine methylase
MKVVDLFAGLKGWSRPFQDRGHETWTTDIDPTSLT